MLLAVELYVVNDEQVLLVLDKLFKRLGEKLAVLYTVGEKTT